MEFMKGDTVLFKDQKGFYINHYYGYKDTQYEFFYKNPIYKNIYTYAYKCFFDDSTSFFKPKISRMVLTEKRIKLYYLVGSKPIFFDEI